jgi:hypothetical protein
VPEVNALQSCVNCVNTPVLYACSSPSQSPVATMQAWQGLRAAVVSVWGCQRSSVVKVEARASRGENGVRE